MKMGLHTHHHPLKLNFHQEQHHIKHMTLPKQNLNIKDNVNSINNIDSNNTTNQTKQSHQNILCFLSFSNENLILLTFIFTIKYFDQKIFANFS